MTAAHAFVPDSALVGSVRPSPNHNARRGVGQPDALVLHYTGMADGPSALARLCDPVAEVSCHYVVQESGEIAQLVPESCRAWHAGREPWAGEGDLNSASVGIEIVNGGHDFGLPPYPDRQIAAVVSLCRDILDRHGIAPSRVLAHSDIAPARKRDPGEHFPWDRLAAAGVGLWVPPSSDPPSASPPDRDAVLAVQRDLAAFGYGIVPTGEHDGMSRLVVEAFQRRYRPARVDGAIDPATRDTLARLMALRFGTGRAAVPARA